LVFWEIGRHQKDILKLTDLNEVLSFFLKGKVEKLDRDGQDIANIDDLAGKPCCTEAVLMIFCQNPGFKSTSVKSYQPILLQNPIY
jgi:hypothetical protein